MTRRLAAPAALSAIVSLALGAPAAAQHHHHVRQHHHDYVQPHQHNYVQPHYDYVQPHHHHVPTYTHPQTVYVQPPTVYPQPSRTTYYRGDDHAHDHAATHAPRHITFGGFSHVDDLAAELTDQANDLCLELHYNYQHNAGFRQTYREAYELLTTAKYIHGLEHSGNREKLRQAVGELDVHFHHVQGHVTDWSGHHHRPVGQGGLTAKLEALEQTLHHLMDDVGVRPAAAGQQAPPSALIVEEAPIVAPRGSYRPGPGPGSAPFGPYAPGSYAPRGSAPQFDAAPPSGEELGPPPGEAPLVVPN